MTKRSPKRNVQAEEELRAMDEYVTDEAEKDPDTVYEEHNYDKTSFTQENEYTEFETLGDRTLVLTTMGKTLGIATERLYDEIDAIEFNGKKYRKDICKVCER